MIQKLVKRFLIKVREKILKIPFIERPFPHKPYKARKILSKHLYEELNKKALDINNTKSIKEFEENSGYSIDPAWFENLSLKTQTCIKKSQLNFNHGKILYSLLSKYIEENNFYTKDKSIIIFETGTARGFSSICMAKAMIDRSSLGLIITIDCLPHNQKIYWNSISDCDGKKSRSDLLSEWEEELSRILFIQGWSDNIIDRLGLQRINFAFLDAQHDKDTVIKEFRFVSNRQKIGDLIIFDDVTKGKFEGVCQAIDEIENNFPYKINRLHLDKDRGYAIAKKIKKKNNL